MYFVRVGLKFMVEMDAESTKVIVEKYYEPLVGDDDRTDKFEKSFVLL